MEEFRSKVRGETNQGLVREICDENKRANENADKAARFAREADQFEDEAMRLKETLAFQKTRNRHLRDMLAKSRRETEKVQELEEENKRLKSERSHKLNKAAVLKAEALEEKNKGLEAEKDALLKDIPVPWDQVKAIV